MKNATVRKYRMAGINEAATIFRYGICVHELIMKAPAPITGGMSWPPVEDAASTAAANRGVNPDRFINGMVREPVPTVFATALPEILPIKPLASTAIFAGPPTVLPIAVSASLMMNSPAPDFNRNAANRTNRNTNVDEIVAILPKMPSGAKYIR